MIDTSIPKESSASQPLADQTLDPQASRRTNAKGVSQIPSSITPSKAPSRGIVSCLLGLAFTPFQLLGTFCIHLVKALLFGPNANNSTTSTPPKIQPPVLNVKVDIAPGSVQENSFNALVFKEDGSIRRMDVYNLAFELASLLGKFPKSSYLTQIKLVRSIMNVGKKIKTSNPHPLEVLYFFLAKETTTQNLIAFKKECKSYWENMGRSHIVDEFERQPEKILPYIGEYATLLDFSEETQKLLEKAAKANNWEKIVEISIAARK